MKNNGVVVLLVFSFVIVVAATTWKLPKELVGTWEGKYKINVQTGAGTGEKTMTSPDSLVLNFTIDDAGMVSGSLGNGNLTGCKVSKNRGIMRRDFHMTTDYIIYGELVGELFPGDPLATRKIGLTFNLDNRRIRGSLFHDEGMKYNMMTNVHLRKK